MRSSSFPALARSSLVGIVATVTDLVALTVLIQGVGCSPAVANIPALLIGLALQFVGNKYWAFEDRSRAFVSQGARFVLVEAGAFCLNALAFHLIVTLTPAPYLLARVLGSSAVYFAWSFPLWRTIFVAQRSS